MKEATRRPFPSTNKPLHWIPISPLVHAAVAVSYMNLGQASTASENATIAYKLRERVSQREKYRIEALYYYAVTGELEKARQL